MPINKNWVVALGLMAMAPGVSWAANPFAPSNFEQPEAAQSITTKEANQRVADQIANVLRKARLTGHNIGIKFENGRATLTGMIANARQKEIATQIVGTIPEVKNVQNDMGLLDGGAEPFRQISYEESATPAVTQAGFEQKGEPIASPIQQVDWAPAPPAGGAQDNQAMAEAIASALQQTGLTGYDIEVSYEDGQVGLFGNVASQQQREMAHQAVSQIPGVTGVNNLLEAPAPAVASNYPPQFQRTAFQGPPSPNGSGSSNAAPAQAMPGPAAVPAPGPMYSHPGPGPVQKVYNQPNLPGHAWPTYANYPNYSQVTYPKQYSASAWPYIGPFYPYPQVPLGWRKASLVWDDGSWQLQFDPKTDRWWWFVNPKNW